MIFNGIGVSSCLPLPCSCTMVAPMSKTTLSRQNGGTLSCKTLARARKQSSNGQNMSIPYFCMGDEPLSPIGGMHTRSEMDAVDWPSYCLSGAVD